jgi:hypothetical protein
MEKDHQVPIWLFIGLLLAVYGVLILGAGLYGYFNPPAHKVALWHLHVDIIWGALLVVIGLAYTIRFWPGKTGR